MTAKATSLLLKHAEQIAAEIAPQTEQDKSGIDPLTIVTIIITIFTTIIEKCPRPTAKALQKPGLLQRGILLKETRGACSCCGGGERMAGDIYRTMLRKGETLSDADATTLIREAQDQSNLLV